jgi:hypothetical protein
LAVPLSVLHGEQEGVDQIVDVERMVAGLAVAEHGKVPLATRLKSS